MNTKYLMRNIFGWGAVLVIAGACVGLYWPLIALGIAAMSFAFGSVYIYYSAKGNR